MQKVRPGMAGPYSLAVDCSGRVGSVALGMGPDLIKEIVFSGKMRHSSELFPAMSQVLNSSGCKPQDIEFFCLTAGPGSFTGLRIAVSTAKMLNFAQDTSIVAVNTMDAIVENATEYIEKTKNLFDKLIVILDAKQSQFFTSVYKRKDRSWQKLVNDTLMSSELLINYAKKDQQLSAMLAGEGLFYHSEFFKSKGMECLPSEYWCPKASNVLKIGYKMAQEGNFSDPQKLVPAYIRLPDAVEKWGNKEVL